MKPTIAIARLAVLAAPLLLGACSLLGGGEREAGTIYAPAPQIQADAAWPRVDWQLAVNTPTAARTVDTFRIAVRPVPGELQVYAGASWARAPSDMVEDVILRTLEDSGRVPGVARRGSGIAPDYRLLLDLRRFEADYAGTGSPVATIELHAKLLHTREQGIAASQTFTITEPAAATDVGSVAEAYTRALGVLGRDVAAWTLDAGEQHARQRPPL
ncbi:MULTISPECIES: ABC-type transport auxiliary lipoprotein family protein [unclassified Luteimonas]|uniref:ABC-type transport auxiliary lipoprotein family protein n=1 Tax=unclassified Luteimonas TaxID=2629088 RepID=UPI0018F0E060|nr:MULTISPECIES: ABC-type transport auxiliary lipoprotein family protein [unclassified Luteimonas]MBJ6978570.1 membrane integrity-associated transporter subunit PqiC [Luteimonas sp. MC1895]MBJ6983467.1 membrane integrity-associated transporter subunit PqiC [Luteimonas sp. MC1750]QQO06319.1 membrane integrity-associated transporter subunit PqiC [Luteimonas sp. MC1750]